jgi:hypothetical protein
MVRFQSRLLFIYDCATHNRTVNTTGKFDHGKPIGQVVKHYDYCMVDGGMSHDMYINHMDNMHRTWDMHRDHSKTWDMHRDHMQWDIKHLDRPWSQTDDSGLKDPVTTPCKVYAVMVEAYTCLGENVSGRAPTGRRYYVKSWSSSNTVAHPVNCSSKAGKLGRQ